MRLTDLSLIEQMSISDLEVDQRLELVGFTKNDVDSLKQARPFAVQFVDTLVDEFYELQTNVPDIAQLIGDAGTLERLASAQRRYILDLFSGLYDLEYVENRLRIGLVHKRAGVDPKLYISAVYTLKTLIYHYLKERIDAPIVSERAIVALEKLFMFDVTLVFDAFIKNMMGEIETAKLKSDNYARSLEQKIRERTYQLEELSKTDALSGLYNSRFLGDTLIHSLRSAERRGHMLSLVYIDINDFKLINDSEGHVRGDQVIAEFARAIQTVAREEDWCFRYGGDEFCVLLHDCSEEDAYQIYQERLGRELEERLPGLRYSVGVAQAGPDFYPDTEQLIRQADQRMYEMKQQQKLDSLQQG